MKTLKRIVSIALAVILVSCSVPLTKAIDDIELTPPFWGDIYRDGVLNAKDVLKCARVAEGLESTTYEDRCFADVNLDGNLTEDDSKTLAALRVGNISELPAESEAEIIFKAPSKDSYNQGEELDTSGMSVIVSSKKDPSVKYILTENISVSGFNSSTIGTQTLTATFRGLAFGFSVSVNDPAGQVDPTNPTTPMNPTNPANPDSSNNSTSQSGICHWCGKTHNNGFFQIILGFIHSVLVFFFGKKY